MTTPIAAANPRLDAALTYASKYGWPVLPLHSPVGGGCSCGRAECSSVGKHPRNGHGVKDATTDPTVIRSWWETWPDANVGIATGTVSGLVVVDVDSDAGTEALTKHVGALPETPTVRTGKGTQLYLAHPGGQVSNRVKMLPDVDLRGDGGYVVAPGSAHANGKVYEWLTAPDATPLAPLSPKLLVSPSPSSTNPGPTPSVAITNGLRNDTLYRLARSLHAKGCSPETIDAAVRAENAARCRPPLDESEVVKLIDNATGQPDRSDFEMREPVASTSLTISVKEFIDQEIPQPTFLVEPYVPSAGIVFVHGPKSVGKSPLSWALAQAVTSGHPFLSLPTRHARVLYIEVDTPRVLVHPRLKLLRPIPDDWLMHFDAPFNVVDPTDRTTARLKAISREFRPGLVILNTLRKSHFLDDKESDSPGRVYGAIQSLFPEAVTWVVHHDKKSGDLSVPRNTAEDHSGSQAWRNDAQVVLHIVSAGDHLMRIEHTGSQVSDLRPPLTLHLDKDGSHVYTQDDYQVAAVMSVYRSLDATLSKRERVRMISAQLGKGFSERTVWDVLKRAGVAREGEA